MKSALLGAGVAIAGVVYLFGGSEAKPTAEQLVSSARSTVYARLAPQFAAVEAKAATITTVTGDPPVPVRFTFTRVDGEMLGMKAVAGFRTVQIKAWLEDGPAAGETKVKVLFEPESLLARSGEQDPFRALETLLTRTDAQFVEGRRVVALFGPGKTSR